MKLKIKSSKVYEDFMDSKKKILVFRGGTRSTKTYSILQGLLTWLISGKLRHEVIDEGLCSVVRENSATLDSTVMADWKEIISTTFLSGAEEIPVSEFLTEKKGNKSWTFGKRKIEFRGAQDAQKIKGAKRKILYCNEANELDYDTQFFQLLMRTTDLVIIDLNPDDEDVWINTEIEEKRFFDKKDVEIFVSTYKDNPFLPLSMVEEIEYLKTRDPEMWKVYGLGQYGQVTGVIFKKGIHYEIVDEVPKEAKLLGYGLDFGYSSDPTSVVAIYKWNGKIVAEEIIYEPGLNNRQLAELLVERGVVAGYPVYCDSSEPKSIDELIEYGIEALPVEKGPGSILYGIQKMKQYEILITANSKGILKELKKYIWIKDKNGKSTKRPIDKFNHSIDALRYVIAMIFGESEVGEDSLYIG